MSFSAEQSRRLDEVVTEMAPALHEPMMALVKEFANLTMTKKFGTDDLGAAELQVAEARVFAVTEQDVARELTSRLMRRLINPHDAG